MKNKIYWVLTGLFGLCLLMAGCSSAVEDQKAAVATLAPDEAQAAISAGTTIELAYHDNAPMMPASPWGDGSEQQTPKMAVRFTPDTYPFIPVQVKLFVTNPSGIDQPFILEVYFDKEGRPDESRLLFKMDNLMIPQVEKEMVAFDLPPVTISEGSVWLVVEWPEKPLIDQQGKNSFFLTLDAKLDHPDRNLFCFMNGEWADFASLSPNLGDVVMTLVVSEQ